MVETSNFEKSANAEFGSFVPDPNTGGNKGHHEKGTNQAEIDSDVLDSQLNGLPGDIGRGTSTILAYATKLDIVVMIISCISAIIAGALNPLLTVIYGQLVGAFQDFSNNTISGASLDILISKFTIYFVYLALGEFVFVYIATVGFFYTGECLTQRLRYAYIKAIVRQNIAFFDILGVGEVTTRITSDMNLIQEGISGKISLSLTAAATFSTAFIIAFVEYWKLALVLTCSVVVIAAANIIGMKLAVKYSKLCLQCYSTGALIAEEAIASIRHVSAFGIQETFAKRYFVHLLLAEKAGVKARMIVALMTATFMCTMHLTYGLSLWQGSRFLISGEVSSASVITITMAIVIGALAVGKVAPNMQAFISSIAGAGKVLNTISRISPIDALSIQGKTMPSGAVKGNIVLEGVSLVYPSRADVTVLRNLNLHLPAGKVTALVGPSGCGKSSVVGLIERFYEPVKGRILLDGHDIRSLNVRWLRQQISLVGQEPILFSTTIFENIRHGLLGIPASTSDIGEEEMYARVVAAAKIANAHDFITALPEAYQTEVGEAGLQLSGGQRQRIVIARALISNPKILLLDEATSALDSKAEKEVQKALESAAEGRTTLIIAHRLATIRKADIILVLGKESGILEEGTHEELMVLKGVYATLVQKQKPLTGNRNNLNSETRDYVKLEGKQAGGQFSTEFHQKNLKESGSVDEEELLGVVESTSQESLWALAKVVWRLNRPEILLMMLGLAFAIIAGLVNPVQSIFFANSIDALSLLPPEYGLLRRRINFWSSLYLMLGLTAFITWLGQGYSFSVSSERLTLRARDQSFRSILRQQIAFFDEKAHSTGALTALLSTKSTQLAGLSGAVLGAILTASATLAGGIILSLIIGWKLALVCTATIPIILGCGWARIRLLTLFEVKVRKAHEQSATYATEAVTSIRTIASLSLEDHVLQHYSSILASTSSKSLKSILKASTLYAASQSCVFLVAALGFWYGGGLISTHEYSMLQFFICFAALISGSQSVGAVFSFAPDISKATNAARELKTLFDRTPDIDTVVPSGARIERCEGRLEMKDVTFRYPSRQENIVLDGFTMSVSPGRFLALVGASGCGKSTVISLLERFFDPDAGKIFVDGHDISTLNINDYRRLIALVGQEPAIYQGSIRDNIVLGSEENIREEAVVQACKDANIFDFIMSLPDGFSTIVGTRGSLLSGGQKQRLAIARALLRNTKILLLDEATSALDADSEKAVQEALESARKGRTTICVAHRMGTIRGADEILVLDKGRVAERGTHEELMQKGGAYTDLVNLQSLENSGD